MTPRSLPLPFILCSALAACSDLTAPAGSIRGAPGTPDPAVGRIAPAATPAPAEPPPMALPRDNPGEEIRASHVLIAYQGALRAGSTITRTKEEAKQRAEEIARRAQKGESFPALAKEASDDPTAKIPPSVHPEEANVGDLGKFSRDRMVKPFADAAFALKPGQISDVVETQFGFHVIKRTE
jgi:peptidyl-prolyl cis-trans isomerase NIMA-interacting 1